jgi:hypothetical protein
MCFGIEIGILKCRIKDLFGIGFAVFLSPMLKATFERIASQGQDRLN